MKSWYNNHGREGQQDGQPVLDLGGKQTKALAPWQGYMKLYYTKKLKEIVDARYNQLEQDVASGLISKLPPVIKFRNEVVRELFNAEPADVHEEVAKFVRKLKQGDGDEGDEEAGEMENTQAQAYLKCVLS